MKHDRGGRFVRVGVSVRRWLGRSRWRVAGSGLLLAGLLAVVGVGVSQTTAPSIPTVALSAEPLYARGFRAKPTLTLALSVEFPTVGAAYVNGSDASNDATYASTTQYVGYFDPNGCYTYDDTKSHFVRGSTATARECDGETFSGNFMNWATSSAIDILRYGLTGGDRIEREDTDSKTVLQRAVLRNSFYNSSNFPSKQIAAGSARKALPKGLIGSVSDSSTVYVANCLNRIYFGTQRTGICDSPGSNANLGAGTAPAGSLDGSLGSTYESSSCASENGSCTVPSNGNYLVAYGASNKFYVREVIAGGTVPCTNDLFGDPISGTAKKCYQSKNAYSRSGTKMTSELFFFSRVQVCESSDASSRPDLCKLQGNGGYKPTGNLQRYSDRLRVAVFGYLKDDTLERYGGVLRVPMKYVGPKEFDKDFKLLATTNSKAEWNETTGVFITNPESAGEGNSGAINYLNKFGRTGTTPGEYKTYDPVSELYYEALRYLQGLAPTDAAFPSTITATHKDGFPVFKTWTDPHPAVTNLSTSGTDTYACIKNNILTIGDVNTHADKTLPGNTLTTNGDTARTASVSKNEPDFVAWTKVVGAFESRTAVKYFDGKGRERTTSNPSTENDNNENLETKVPNCCNDNRYYMAGAAYWANTHDIRASGLSGYSSDLARPGMRVKTYMIDVNEYGQQTSESRFKQNQFYLAAKYGGFTDKSQTGNPFLAEDGVTKDDTNWARSVPTTLASDGLVAKTYFQGNNATELLAALDGIFANVVQEAGSIAGAAVSGSRLSTDVAVYQGSFDPSDWSGDLVRYQISRGSDGSITIGTATDSSTRYASTLLDKITDLSTRKIFVGKTTPGSTGTATEFKWSVLDSDHKTALKTPAALTPLDSDALAEKRVDYLRGDRTEEATGTMRRRGSRLGDIVNSGAVYVGKPATLVGDSSYDTFVTSVASRPAAVYVGANDGMLHAFHADTLAELFAYVPSFVVKNLRDYTLPTYSHRSYVDATPVVAEAQVGTAWKTVLVSGAGGGGQGVFALDVSNPSSFTATNVMWEFTERDDASIGHVIGRPKILRLRTSAPGATATYKYFAVVAGGVNNYASDGYFSSTGKPAIFLLDLAKTPTGTWQQGTNYYKIELPTGDTSKANGIAGFVTVSGAAGEVQLLYAGDLQGNLWKLNFGAVGSTSWTAEGLTAFKTGSTPLPLFTAKDASDVGQPITAEPKVINGPNGSYIVTFGTGRFLELNDLTTPYPTQSFYAVYDNGKDRVPGRAYLKAGTASNGVVSTDPFVWGLPASADVTTVRAGWYVNFPGSSTGERQISGIAIVGGYAVFGTVEPAANGCADGSGRVYYAALSSGDGAYSASTVGIQGEPLLVKVGTDAYTSSTSVGRSQRTTTWQIVLQGSAGIKLPDGLATGSGTTGSFSETAQVRERSWRQIFNYDAIKNSP